MHWVPFFVLLLIGMLFWVFWDDLKIFIAKGKREAEVKRKETLDVKAETNIRSSDNDKEEKDIKL